MVVSNEKTVLIHPNHCPMGPINGSINNENRDKLKFFRYGEIMKNRILLVCLPLLLASSLCYTADDTEQIQQKMNVFKSAMKTFQKKMNLYTRCVKGKCSQAEKEQARADMKKAAKIAIPTAIAITALVVGRIIYKKYGGKSRMAKAWFQDAKTPSEEKAYMIRSAIQNDNLTNFKEAIQDISILGFNQRRDLVFVDLLLYNKFEMLEALIESHPELINVRTTSKKPLLSEVIERNEKLAETLIEHKDILIIPDNVPFLQTPLFIAAEMGNDKLLKRILREYDLNDLKMNIQELENDLKNTEAGEVIQGRKFFWPEEFKAETQRIISKIKRTAGLSE